MPRKQQRIMGVTVDFQPNRMEEEIMSKAYESILPLERNTCQSARNTVKVKGGVEHPMQLAIFPGAVAQ